MKIHDSISDVLTCQRGDHDFFQMKESARNGAHIHAKISVVVWSYFNQF